MAVAASAAWYLAALIFGHEQPFVAPIATVISRGDGRRDGAAGELDEAVRSASERWDRSEESAGVPA